jgi:alkylhydroperoxidase family enzyme
MPGQAAFRDLVDRVQHGAGTASPELRAQAFANEGLPPRVATLIAKVATTPASVTEADFAAAEAAGYSQDQLFELVICAAVGQSSRQYEAGLAALAEALGSSEASGSGDAP